ncbi:MAG: O-antigen ligase family protein [Candidatus Pacebacteria bacterium]|nr:O-antigen ligase family protein [Candidatus Paceibacterota bacterium]
MISKKNKIFIYQFLFGLVIFLVPSNLFFKFFESSAYVNGLLLDYLIPKLYLSDLIIFSLYGWWLFENKKSLLKKFKTSISKLEKIVIKHKLISGLVLALFLRQFNADHNIAAYWYLFKIIEIGIFGLLLLNKRKLITNTVILTSTIFTLFFQSGVAILQFMNQSSIAGYLFLGEANLSKQIGLAKQIINGVEKILPYGTTAHPNILGGIISLYLIILIGTLVRPELKKKKYHQQPFIWGPIILSLIALGLTFSLSAWLTFIIGTILIFIKLEPKKLILGSIAILILVPFLLQFGSKFSDNPSINRRAYLNQTAINMLKNNPVWGVGLNNFTSRVEEYSPTREVVRFTQPSHNSILLVLSEFGLLGLVTIVLIKNESFKIFKKNKKQLKTNIMWGSIIVAIMTPIIVLDHYLITNQSGLLLLVIIGVLTRKFLIQPQK